MALNKSPLSVLYQSFKKSLKGEEQLRIAFWGWFVLPNVAEGIINNLFHFDRFSFLISLFPPTISGLNTALAIHIALLVLFIAFWAIIIWRCAKNSNKKIWFYAARVFVSLFVLATGYRLIELALDVTQKNIG